MKILYVIFAAGKGTRLKIEKPKCLVEILNKPLIEYIFDEVSLLNDINSPIFILTGYQKHLVENFFTNKNNIYFVEQKEQLGTGHALKTLILDPQFNLFAKDYTHLMVLYSDAPLINNFILNEFVKYNNIEILLNCNKTRLLLI